MRRSRGCWTRDATISVVAALARPPKQRLDETRPSAARSPSRLPSASSSCGVARPPCARTRTARPRGRTSGVGDRGAPASRALRCRRRGRRPTTSAARRRSVGSDAVVGCTALPKTSATTPTCGRRPARREVGERAAQLRRVAHGARRGEQLAGGVEVDARRGAAAPPSSPRGPEWSRCPLRLRRLRMPRGRRGSGRRRPEPSCRRRASLRSRRRRGRGRACPPRCAATRARSGARLRSARVRSPVRRAASAVRRLLAPRRRSSCRPRGRRRGSRRPRLRASASWAVYSSSAASALRCGLVGLGDVAFDGRRRVRRAASSCGDRAGPSRR